MGALKEKPSVQSTKRPAIATRSAKSSALVVKTKVVANDDELTPEQEALYGAISSNTKNDLSAAAARAAKYANRK